MIATNADFHANDAVASAAQRSLAGHLQQIWEVGSPAFDQGFANLASITSQQDAQVLLSAQVADLYFAYRTTMLRIDIAQQNVAIQKRSFEITEKIFKAGQDSELDVQQAKTQYLSTLATIPDLEETLVKLRNALAALLGRKPGDVPELASVKGDLPAMSRWTSGRSARRCCAGRISARPPGRSPRSRQISVAKPTTSGHHAARRHRLGELAPPNLTRLDLVAARPDVECVRLRRIPGTWRLRTAVAESVSFSGTACRQRGTNTPRSRGNRRAATDVSTMRSAPPAALPLNFAGTLSGRLRDFQRVIDAQRALFAQAEQQLINHSDYISAVIELYKSLGGGWIDMSVEQMIPESVRDEMESRTNWGGLLDEPLPTDTGP
jgi:hypothetical protein